MRAVIFRGLFFIVTLTIISTPLLLCQQNDSTQNLNPARFKGEIDAFIQWDAKNSYPSRAVLFIGSSSIRMWHTHLAFPEYPVINRGFGGAITTDVIYYYENVVKKYKAEVIVLYVGDNDIAVGKSVEEVFEDYKKLVAIIKNDNPICRLIYLPIKPSIRRWTLWEKMNDVNMRIKEYNENDEKLFYLDTATPMIGTTDKPNESLFIEDGLHLNAEGYALWDSLLDPLLKQCY